MQDPAYFTDLLEKTNQLDIKTFLRNIINKKLTSKRASLFPEPVLEPGNSELVVQLASFLRRSFRLTITDHFLKFVVVPEVIKSSLLISP